MDKFLKFTCFFVEFKVSKAHFNTMSFSDTDKLGLQFTIRVELLIDLK